MESGDFLRYFAIYDKMDTALTDFFNMLPAGFAIGSFAFFIALAVIFAITEGIEV